MPSIALILIYIVTALILLAAAWILVRFAVRTIRSRGASCASCSTGGIPGDPSGCVGCPRAGSCPSYIRPASEVSPHDE